MTSSRPYEQPELPIFETGQADHFPAAPGESLSPYPRPELARRLDTLRETYGFMPTSEGEASEAYGLVAPEMGYLGALNRLEAIGGAQFKKGVESPHAAVRRVTHEYAEYAWKARVDGWQLRTLDRELNELDVRSEGRSLRQVEPLSGVTQLVRYYDLRRLVGEGTASIEPFVHRADGGRRSALDPYTTSRPTRNMRDHLGRMAEAITVGRATQLGAAAVADQQARESFWVAQLRQARTHRVAGPVAEAALARMKIDF